MSFRYVSLFAGIGGFDTALNELGGECVMASEIDKYAVQAYELIYGHKPAGDVTKIDAVDVPDHDVLVAGFPCQAFSVAGQRKGFEDTRGTLFFEVARIAKHKRPLENVKGLMSHDGGRTLDVIIATLNEIGYTVDFEVLNSKYFGVPQNRERIFIACVLDGKEQPWNIEGNNMVAKAKCRLQEAAAKVFNFDWPTNNTVTTRLRDILEPVVSEKYYLDKTKTAALIVKLEADLDAARIPVTDDPEVQIVGNLKPDDCTRLGQRDEVYADSGVIGALNASDYKVQRHKRSARFIYH
ncbi:DNA (cytosine-5-)-methyltransferase [Paenibacillus agaridevorans]|uniref:DNA (cytosine-5-)-methyltransferase n=1 Tax=Paenibacillus agaridevorans TaxID=171404 RepID=UPI001BE489BE|nr:DNA (cytosine-5-)-methyltransferase [Paenibacillus agaridevorans]